MLPNPLSYAGCGEGLSLPPSHWVTAGSTGTSPFTAALALSSGQTLGQPGASSTQREMQCGEIPLPSAEAPEAAEVLTEIALGTEGGLTPSLSSFCLLLPGLAN